MKKIIALSGGKDSTAMALRLAEVEPDDYQFIYTPTGNELPEMERHWKRLEALLGSDIISLTADTLKDLVWEQHCLPNWRMRWCTRMIKIEPFQEYILGQIPCTVFIGMRADEEGRDGVEFEKLHKDISRRYPLMEWGWGIEEVKTYLATREVEIPERTDCALCFFQTINEWFALWTDHPEMFEEGIAWEEHVGHTLRSDGRDTWPAALKDLRREFERGRKPRKRRVNRKTMCAVCAR